MKKSKIYTLENGLKLIFYQDTSKHSIIANLFIKFGGTKKSIIVNDNQFDIVDGTAHFLEHLLIENSIYGNALIEFEKNRTRFNGYTNKDVTHFFIDSVYNFEEDLVKLINIVNNPGFDSNSIEDTKPAIIKEIMIDKDEKFAYLNKLDNECAFKNIKYSNILGDVSDIKNITYDYIKMCYDMFYTTNNQILLISGNFDMEKIKELVQKTYEKFSKENTNYKVLNINEPKWVVKKEDFITKDIHLDYVRINYKVDISKFTNKELVKLSFYLDYFLSYLFDSSSKTYNELVNKNICSYDIDYSCMKVDNFMLIKIGTFTDNHNEFINKIKNVIKEKTYNEENFELRKRKEIINLILREDNLNSMISPFIDNIIDYDYYDMDKIEDIEEFTFLEYKNIINSLDFSNYCITKMLKNNI